MVSVHGGELTSLLTALHHMIVGLYLSICGSCSLQCMGVGQLQLANGISKD